MSIFPIYDGRPLRHIRRPYASWALIGLNVLIYLVLEGGGFGSVNEASVLSFGLIPAVFNGYLTLPPPFAVVPDWATILTYSFLHGDFWHLLGNMVFLWVFADNVEDAFGHARFVLFYALCAIGAGYAFVLSDPASQSPVIGASGAIAGVVAAYLILHPRQKIWVLALGRIPLRLGAFWVLGFWVAVPVLFDPRRAARRSDRLVGAYRRPADGRRPRPRHAPARRAAFRSRARARPRRRRSPTLTMARAADRVRRLPRLKIPESFPAA